MPTNPSVLRKNYVTMGKKVISLEPAIHRTGDALDEVDSLISDINELHELGLMGMEQLPFIVKTSQSIKQIVWKKE